MSWPTDEALSSHWPVLGRIGTRVAAGSGWRLACTTGRWYLKRRPAGRAGYEVAITDALSSELPVTRFAVAADGSRWLRLGDGDFLVYPELAGAAVTGLGGAQGVEHAAALGAACARLHQALARVAVPVPAPGPLTKPIPAPVASALARAGSSADLPQQLIHRDFHPGNVLFNRGVVSGYLDFDHLIVGPRPLDLSYCLGSILARRLERDRPRIEQWLALAGGLVSGYLSVAPLRPAELARIAPLTVEVEAEFLDYFLSIDDRANEQLTERLILLLDRLQPRIAAAIGRLETGGKAATP